MCSRQMLINEGAGILTAADRLESPGSGNPVPYAPAHSGQDEEIEAK